MGLDVFVQKRLQIKSFDLSEKRGNLSQDRQHVQILFYFYTKNQKNK